MTNEKKAKALLGSPAGCALILDLSANSHLPLEHFAEPKVSFWLAATAIDFTDVYRDAGWSELALREAGAYHDLARKVVNHPAFDWWYEPFDAASQIWSSPQMALGPDRSPLRPFAPERWRTPGPPDPGSSHQNPTSTQQTSTLRDGSTSEWTAFTLGAADHTCAWPLVGWQVRFHQDVRVREINHPADWHTLCAEYPSKGPDGRLVPDWSRVAETWDGVHLTLGGMLSCEQARYEDGGEWSMMQFWHSEQTHWLNRLRITGERMPDTQCDHNEQKFNIFPYGPELYLGAGHFELMPDIQRDHNEQNLDIFPYGPELYLGEGHFELR